MPTHFYRIIKDGRKTECLTDKIQAFKRFIEVAKMYSITPRDYDYNNEDRVGWKECFVEKVYFEDEGE